MALDGWRACSWTSGEVYRAAVPRTVCASTSPWSESGPSVELGFSPYRYVCSKHVQC